MNSNIILLPGLLMSTTPVFAHIGFQSDAGVLANIIAVGIVVFSIVVYFLIGNRTRRKIHHKAKNKVHKDDKRIGSFTE